MKTGNVEYGGKTYQLAAPDDATDEQAQNAVMEYLRAGAAPAGFSVTEGGFGQQLGTSYRQGREALIEKIPDPGYGVGPALKGAARTVIPETLGQAAGDVALSVLPGGAATSVGGRIVKGVGRALGAAGATYAGDVATGEGERAATDAALTGAGGAAGSLVGEGVRAGKQYLGKSAQNAADVSDLAATLKGTVPGQTGVQMGESVFRGDATRRAAQHMEDVQQQLTKAVPWAGQALDQVKMLKQAARAEEAAGKGAIAFRTRKMSEAAEENLMVELRKTAPELEQSYRASVADFSRSEAVETFLKDPKGWSKEGIPDFDYFKGKLKQGQKGASDTWWERLERSGARDVIDTLGRGDSAMLRDTILELRTPAWVGNVQSSARPGRIGVEGGIPAGSIRIPTGRTAIPPRDPRIDTLLGGILGRMTGQSAGFGRQ